MIRVLVNGAQGKMGQECIRALAQEKELTLVAETGKTDDLAKMIQQVTAQVVVDFTTPTAVYKNALTIIESGAHPVIGTTGLAVEQIAALVQQCKKQKLGGIIAPNFSLGAVLMMRFAEEAAKFFSDVEIIELHHPAKLDSPSGTALKTADGIAKNRSTTKSTQSSRETIVGARGALSHGIPIHAVRLPGLVASQEVLFGGLGETLRICHNTIHREAFMPGVMLACKKVSQLDHMVYGLENIL